MGRNGVLLIATLMAVYMATFAGTVLSDAEYVFNVMPLLLILVPVYAMIFREFVSRYSHIKLVADLERMVYLMLLVAMLLLFSAIAVRSNASMHGLLYELYETLVKASYLWAYTSIMIMCMAEVSIESRLGKKSRDMHTQ